MSLRTVVVLHMLLAAGCTSLRVRRGDSPTPDGLRVYPPRVLLLVDAEADGGKGRSTLLVVPDLSEPYDVRPVAFLARHDFRLEVEDGMLKSVTSGQDSAAGLALVKSAADLGARAAGVGVSARDFEGHYGLTSGIYLLRPDGSFVRVRDPVQAPARPPDASR